MPFVLQLLIEGGKESLGACVILHKVFIRGFVVLRVFVEGKVSQMHEEVSHVVFSGKLVVLGAESC